MLPWNFHKRDGKKKYCFRETREIHDARRLDVLKKETEYFPDDCTYKRDVTEITDKPESIDFKSMSDDVWKVRTDADLQDHDYVDKNFAPREEVHETREYIEKETVFNGTASCGCDLVYEEPYRSKKSQEDVPGTNANMENETFFNGTASCGFNEDEDYEDAIFNGTASCSGGDEIYNEIHSLEESHKDFEIVYFPPSRLMPLNKEFPPSNPSRPLPPLPLIPLPHESPSQPLRRTSQKPQRPLHELLTREEKHDSFESMQGPPNISPKETSNANVAYQKRDRFYKERIAIFKQKILNDLKISQVLPYLTFIEETQQRDIRSMAERDPKNAVEVLLDVLGDSFEERVWPKFLQALKQAGFVDLASIILGYDLVNISQKKTFLNQMAPTIREMINPLELLPYLIDDMVINPDDKQNIEHRQRNEGDISATDLLLDRITCKSQYWHGSLLNALMATKQTDVANMMNQKKSIHFSENVLQIDDLRPPPPPPGTQIPPVELETDPVDVDFVPPKRTPLGIPIPPIEKETDPDGVDQLRPPLLPPRIPIPPSKLETDTYDESATPDTIRKEETESDSEWESDPTVDFLPPKRTPLGIPIPPIEGETNTDGDLSTSDVPELPPRCPLICTIKRKRSCRHIKAISTYTAENPQELSHAIGDVFEIKELYPTWFWAKSIDSSSAGIVFRVNVVYLQAPSPKNPENSVGEAPIYYNEFDDEDISSESNTVVEVCNETRVPKRKNYENVALDCEKKTWYTAINSLFTWNFG